MNHQDYLDEYYDGNCPVCGEPFESFSEFYPESDATLMTENEPPKVCVRSSCNSASPDPILFVYRHGNFDWEDNP